MTHPHARANDPRGARPELRPSQLCLRALGLVIALGCGACSLFFDGKDLRGKPGGSANLAVGASDQDLSTGDSGDLGTSESSDLGHGCTPRSSISFAATAIQSGGGNPAVLGVGDFNEDGKLDYAVLNTNDSTIAVFLGAGGASFIAAPGSPHAVCASGGGANAFTVGRFNADAHQDLLVGCSGNPGTAMPPQTLYLMAGSGTGGFGAGIASAALTGHCDRLITADFDVDGRDDFAVAHDDGNSHYTVQLGLQKSAGVLTLQPVLPGSSEVDGMAVADLFGDGAPELIVTHYDQLLTIYKSQRAGGNVTYSAASYSSPSSLSAIEIAVADLNGDHKPDILVADAASGGGNVGVYLFDAMTNDYPAAPTLFPTGNGASIATAVADFDCDGKPDVAATSMTDDRVAILRGNGSGGFLSPAAANVALFSAPILIVADLNGDGLPDLIASGRASPAVEVNILLNTSQ